MYERKTETFEIWTAIVAGVIEDTRRVIFAQEQIKIINEAKLDPAEMGVRLMYPLMACVTPLITWEEFISLPPRVVDGIARAVVAVNPEWDVTGELTEKKSEAKPNDGTKSLQMTTAPAKKRRHSPQK